MVRTIDLLFIFCPYVAQMPVPIVTFCIIMMRASLRPINNMIIGHFKNANMHPLGFKFFGSLGHGTHKVEMFLANAGKEEGDGKDTKDNTKLSDKQAFGVGVEWFSEVIFFYGTLMGICCWEFSKFRQNQKKLN